MSDLPPRNPDFANMGMDEKMKEINNFVDKLTPDQRQMFGKGLADLLGRIDKHKIDLAEKAITDILAALHLNYPETMMLLGELAAIIMTEQALHVSDYKHPAVKMITAYGRANANMLLGYAKDIEEGRKKSGLEEKVDDIVSKIEADLKGEKKEDGNTKKD